MRGHHRSPWRKRYGRQIVICNLRWALYNRTGAIRLNRNRHSMCFEKRWDTIFTLPQPNCCRESKDINRGSRTWLKRTGEAARCNPTGIHRTAGGHKKLEDLNAQLEEKVEERTSTLQQAYRQLEEQNKVLQGLDQNQDRFVSPGLPWTACTLDEPWRGPRITITQATWC